jgi:hypothetical protein
MGNFHGDLLTWVDSFGYQFSDLLNLLIQTVLSTLIVLITAEFLPKVFFQICKFAHKSICYSSLRFLFAVLFHLFFYLGF